MNSRLEYRRKGSDERVHDPAIRRWIPHEGKKHALENASSQSKSAFADNGRNIKGHSTPRPQTTPATLKEPTRSPGSAKRMAAARISPAAA